MPHYKYVAKDSHGKALNGIVEAANRQDAINIIQKRALLLISISEAKAKSVRGGEGFFAKRVKIDDIVIFSRQLATMVEAGIPLVGALDILSQQIENPRFKRVVLDVRDNVEGGASLSEAMNKYRDIFSELFVNMVKAGEASGMLDEILDRLASYMEKTSALQKKISAALIYPVVVTGMAFSITLLLLIVVIPVFKEVYSGFGAELPLPTRILIAISDSLGRYIFITIAVIIAAFLGFMRYVKTDAGRLAVDRFMLRLPVFGILLKKVAVSKFAKTLSTLLRSGVPILSALEIVGKTSGNKAVEAALDKVRANVHEGETMADPLAKSRIFPPMVVRMVSVGEQSGELEKMLSKIADFYEEQVDAAVSGLTSLIEPFIIVFLGVVIGTIVICMFLPIFKITSIMGV